MAIELELLKIDRIYRPDGELAMHVIFGQPFVPIQKADAQKPTTAKIMISTAPNRPTPVSWPYEVRISMFFSIDEWKTVGEKLIVGKTYNLKITKEGFTLPF